MGNALVKEFDVRGQVATGGPGGVWKVYDGTRKTTGRHCSIFVRFPHGRVHNELLTRATRRSSSASISTRW